MRMFVLVAAALLLAAACGGQPAGQTPAQPTPAVEQPVPPPAPEEQAMGAREIKITMTEFKFAPDTLEVPAGSIKLELTNAGAVEHNFVITETGQRLEAIQPGETGVLEVTLEPGTYHVDCDVPGHKEAGMTMTIVVK